MRRRAGCGRGYAQRSRARNRERGTQVFIIFLPALRFLTGPRPPAALAARFFAAVIRPPLLFFTVITPSLVLQTGPLERAPVSPGNREIKKIIQSTYALVCWPTHTGAPVRSP